MLRGDQLMLSLELVNAETENVIWSEQYNRTQADLVSLQIARDVSSKLRAKLSGAEETKVTRAATFDPATYQAYLKGVITGTDARLRFSIPQRRFSRTPFSHARGPAGADPARTRFALIRNETLPPM